VIKVYGERNTGTNYLVELCRLNLDCEVLEGTLPRGLRRAQNVAPGHDAIRDLYFAVSFPWQLGWKHREVDIDGLRQRRRAQAAHFVVTTKNPYAWLVSTARRPHHLPVEQGCDVVTLCRTPLPTQRREGGPDAYQNAVDMWNRKTRAQLALRDAFSTTVARYEDVLMAPDNAVRQISVNSGIDLIGGGFTNVSNSTKQSGKTFTDYRDYYGAERWRDELDPSVTDEINELLDFELMRQLDYEVM
jgi:hypothetical protein